MKNKKRNLRFLSILVLLFTLSLAANADDYSGYYVGDLSGSYGIHMNLAFNNDGTVKGTYFYTSTGLPLHLEGKYSETEIHLTETDKNGEETGYFEFELDPEAPNVLKGLWRSTPGEGGGLAFPAELNKRIETRHIESKMDNYLEYSVNYPFFIYEDEPGSRLEQLTTRFLNIALEDLQTFFEFSGTYSFDPMFSASLPWSGGSTYSVKYYSFDLISVTHEYYEYTGGAHGNYGSAGYNYYFQDEEWTTLILDEIFDGIPNYISVLSNILIKDLKRQNAMFVEDGEINSFSTSDLENHYVITPAGLLFYFSPYEVGPYVQGEFEVFIPYEDIIDLINSESLLFPFVTE